jgi:predicted acyltransferase
MLLHLAVNHEGGLFGRVGDKTWLADGLVRAVIDRMESLLDAVGRHVSLADSLGSLAGVVMAGCVLGSILRRDSDVVLPRDRIRWALVYALGLFVAGLLTDTFEGVNKNGATPTWCLWCASIATLAWAALYGVVDVSGHRAWAGLFEVAGTNPLLAYLLHPIVLWTLGLVGLEPFLLNFAWSPVASVAVGGSALMALLVCTLTLILTRLGIRLRL